MTELSHSLELTGFPPPARADIICDSLRLAECADFCAHLGACGEEYRKNGTLDYASAAGRAGELAQSVGVSAYTGALIFFLSLIPDALAFYRAQGYDEALFRASFHDLALKSIECRKVRGVWGVDTNWFGRFFDLTRFTLGRLEFEVISLDYPFAGLEAGAPVINIHIPELGPLVHGDCLAAYAMAVKMFPRCVREGKAVFVCSSWLLAHELKTFLPPESNILRFARDFTVLHTREEAGFPDGWRVFGADFKRPPQELPRDTVLRRGYADYLCDHTHTTVCYGGFVYDTVKETVLKEM